MLQAKAALQSPQSEKILAEQALRQSEETFEFAHAALNKFMKGDFRIRKEVLAAIGSNHSLRDENLIFEARKPFAFIQKFKSGKGTYDERIEPEKTQVAKGQSWRTEPSNLCRLRDVDKVRTKAEKIRILAHKVYHFFRSSKSGRDDTENHLRNFEVN